MRRIGLISDTHGLLRPEAKAFLVGCELIVHAGDITDAGVLEELGTLAPVVAVRGNNDRGAWASQLQEAEFVTVGESVIYVIHDLALMAIEPGAAGVDVVVSGHTHKPFAERRGAVLFINPGSAGPRRFKLPVAVGELSIVGNTVSGRVVELDLDGRP